MKDEICKIHLASELIDFKNTVVKQYLNDNENTENYFPTLAKIPLVAQNLPPDTPHLLVTKTSLISTIKPCCVK